MEASAFILGVLLLSITKGVRRAKAASERWKRPETCNAAAPIVDSQSSSDLAST